MTALPIPVSEIYAYCLLFGIEDIDERVEFFTTMRTLDDLFLQEQRKAR